jgi:hypothetical protein
MRGASRSSRTLERDAVDAAASARRSRRAGYSVSDHRTRKTTALKRLRLKASAGLVPSPSSGFFEGVADGEVVWSWHPLLVSSLAEVLAARPGARNLINPRGDGGKKELVTKESAKETVKTIRVRECRAISGASAVNTRAHISLPSAYGAAGALGARHSPRPLSKRANVFGKSRAQSVPRGEEACQS